jgi:four helix bundle protein
MFTTNFRELDAWQVSMDLAETIYGVAERLPRTEVYELSRPIRRAAVSIPSNVAEGHATKLHGRCRHHLRLAMGSAAELSTQLELASRFGYLTGTERAALEKQIVRVNQLLSGLIRRVTRDIQNRR